MRSASAYVLRRAHRAVPVGRRGGGLRWGSRFGTGRNDDDDDVFAFDLVESTSAEAGGMWAPSRIREVLDEERCISGEAVEWQGLQLHVPVHWLASVRPGEDGEELLLHPADKSVECVVLCSRTELDGGDLPTGFNAAMQYAESVVDGGHREHYRDDCYILSYSDCHGVARAFLDARATVLYTLLFTLHRHAIRAEHEVDVMSGLHMVADAQHVTPSDVKAA